MSVIYPYFGQQGMIESRRIIFNPLRQIIPSNSKLIIYSETFLEYLQAEFCLFLTNWLQYLALTYTISLTRI